MEEGENDSARIRELKDSLVVLMDESGNVGKEAAIKAVPVTHFLERWGGVLVLVTK